MRQRHAGAAVKPPPAPLRNVQVPTCFAASSHLQTRWPASSTAMTASSRDQLLLAAAHLYGEHGFRGTTTRRIAHEAGVNEVTLFRLFGSKTALMLEAIRTHGASLSSAELPEVPRDPLPELTDSCAHKRRSL